MEIAESEKIEISESRQKKMRLLLSPRNLAAFILFAGGTPVLFHIGWYLAALFFAAVTALISYMIFLGPLQKIVIEKDGIILPKNMYGIKILFAEIARTEQESDVLKIWLTPEAKKTLDSRFSEASQKLVPSAGETAVVNLAESVADVGKECKLSPLEINNKYFGADAVIAGAYDFEKIGEIINSRLLRMD